MVSEEEGAIRITHGYSRDKRPDLKQFMVDLICSGDGDVPLYLRVGSGNESDQGIFAQLIKEFREEWNCEALFVADAALYSKENLESLVNLRWLSRVPAKIKEAQKLMEQLSDEAFESSKLEGYRYNCVCSTYSGIKQRWLTVESEERKKSDLKKLEEKIEEQEKVAQKQLQSLSQQEFACAEDALVAGMKWSKKLIYHRLEALEAIASPYYRKAGRPKKDQVPDGYRYHLQGSLTQNEETIALARAKAGRFVLATNVLDSESLSNEQILCEYKAQQSTERGFRFLKDPLFFASSVFLKTPERIAALAMVMGLCLLVYTLAQRALRQALTQAKQTIPNQLGKPTATPTMRWVFQCFQSIHLVVLDGAQQVVNLTMEHHHIIQFLGSACQKYYLLV